MDQVALVVGYMTLAAFAACVLYWMIAEAYYMFDAFMLCLWLHKQGGTHSCYLWPKAWFTLYRSPFTRPWRDVWKT